MARNKSTAAATAELNAKTASKQKAAPAQAANKAAPKAATNKGTPKAAADKTPAEPKTPAPSANLDLIQAAIDGTLKADPAHAGAADDDRLTKVSENGRPSGRPIGVTTGLGVQLAWCFIFQANEKAPKAKKLTDEGITAWLNKEFPGREAAVFSNVAGVRRKYNLGGLTRNQAPKVQSSRYDDKGEVTNNRGGPVGEDEPAAPAEKGGKKASK